MVAEEKGELASSCGHLEELMLSRSLSGPLRHRNLSDWLKYASFPASMSQAVASSGCSPYTSRPFPPGGSPGCWSLKSHVDFVERLRDELWFPNVDALVEQMHKDAALARDVLTRRF